METNQIQQFGYDEVKIDLEELFFVLWRKIWLLIIVAIVCGGIAGIWTKTMITPMYRSSSMLYILSQSTSITSLADVQMGTQLTKDYAVLIKSRPVVDEIISNLDLEMPYDDLLKLISIENQADTRIINIMVTHSDPGTAKMIADEIASVSAKQMAEIMKTEEPSIIGEGQIADTPSSPNLGKNCALAGFAGLMAISAILIGLHLLDDRLKTGDDVEQYLGLTTLGRIPMDENEKKEEKERKLRRNRHKRSKE